MFTLDDNFLADVGLADLPETQRKAFLQHVYEEIELRTGTVISDGMSDAQLEEYEKIIDRDFQAITMWIDETVPDFLNDPIYQRMSKSLADASDAEVVCEYAATKWLEVNRPDYQEIVKQILDDIADEIRRAAHKILGG